MVVNWDQRRRVAFHTLRVQDRLPRDGSPRNREQEFRWSRRRVRLTSGPAQRTLKSLVEVSAVQDRDEATRHAIGRRTRTSLKTYFKERAHVRARESVCSSAAL